jgi:hypothetical protein
MGCLRGTLSGDAASSVSVPVTATSIGGEGGREAKKGAASSRVGNECRSGGTGRVT